MAMRPGNWSLGIRVGNGLGIGAETDAAIPNGNCLFVCNLSANPLQTTFPIYFIHIYMLLHVCRGVGTFGNRGTNFPGGF